MTLVPDDTQLAAFVKHSNYIEGIFAGPHDEWHFGHHLAAAKFVRSSKVLLPIDGLHAAIMLQLLDRGQFPGEYRTDTAYYGTRAMPKPAAVAPLMNGWYAACTKVQTEFEQGELCGNILVASLDWLHSYALCIHPFPDGNGRTFRLFLNHLRQRCGLPWRIYEPNSGEWEKLLCKLRAFEERTFRPQHLWAYDPDT